MQGRNLAELCASTHLRILNGRFWGDSLGLYTCFKHNGSSTVDYIIASSHILDRITAFRVEPYRHVHLSDHGLLKTIECSITEQNPTPAINETLSHVYMVNSYGTEIGETSFEMHC